MCVWEWSSFFQVHQNCLILLSIISHHIALTFPSSLAYAAKLASILKLVSISTSNESRNCYQVLDMFDILFGWSKASKCKRAIKRTRCRLKLLKNKREAIARQLRRDLAELIQSGHEETAFNRVEQLIEDESLAAAYELLDHYCEFLLTQFSYIRRNKDCPNDINEAASSLIFASARCGELPELCVIRKLFGERYSENFAATAVELFPGNLVNKQLKENLSGKPVSDVVKYRMVDEIVRDNCIQQQVLAIQYYPNWQQEQVKENKGYQLVENGGQINNTVAISKVHPSEVQEIRSDATCVSSFISKPNDSCSSPKSTLIDVSAMVSTVQQYPPYIHNCSMQKKAVNFPGILSHTNSGMQNNLERMALPSSKEMVDYADDIEEYCQFSVSKDGTCQDQTLFKFRPSGLFKREETQFGCDESDTHQDESSSSSSEKSSIRASRRSKRAPEKRSRRRSASLEILGRIMDTEYMVYYNKPCRNPSAHKRSAHCREKHLKPSLEAISQSRRKSFDVKMRGCSLDRPCYFCHYDDDKDCLESLSVKPKRLIKGKHIDQGVLLDECCHSQPFMELVNITQRQSRKSYDDGNNEIAAETSASIGSYASTNVTNLRTNNGSLIRIQTEAPYSRAMTMPQEQRGNCNEKMLRTYSCPPQHPNHVHPKLPEYDDIAAKFTALKRECQGNKDRRRDRQ